MKRHEVLRRLREHKADLERFGVESLALFGSAARDEAGKGSDVDLLVQFGGSPCFSQYMELRFFLEELLGCQVDLVTWKALKPQMRDQVEKEAIRVA